MLDTLQKVRVNLPAVAAADEDPLERMVSYFIFIHIIYTVATFIKLPSDPSWIVELTSFALRIILWLVLPILLFPKKKELWLIMIASLFNVPSGISDIVYVDEFDNLFIFLKLLFLLPALFIVIRRLHI